MDDESKDKLAGGGGGGGGRGRQGSKQEKGMGKREGHLQHS